MKKVTDMTIAELVAEYNAATGKDLKKFQDRATAEKKVSEIREKTEIKIMPVAVKPKPITAEDLLISARTHSENRSIGVKRTWTNPGVRENRMTRANVEVDGILYTSLREAFAELGLPMKKHIAFRIELKKIGKLRCSFGDRTMMFKAIPVERQLAG